MLKLRTSSKNFLHISSDSLQNVPLNSESKVQEALKKAFLKADKMFLDSHEKGDKKSLNEGAAGACSIVALVTNDTVYVANAGDCRGVLGIKQGTNRWCE